ncbi:MULTISPECIES: 4'-phosphopantetheinyl transferase family protein [Rhizobium]|uniref:4'-phosphopantetheinyl transferase family protein n=1 Tax=Rhizobium TaxID=379 RepID=UPI0007EBF6BA|nr:MULTISPECIES: 4'-phosphopantetheinyl transferase superfamily protein [Rhizobium]ANK95411.1 4'-phosphopantetheinyl transferase protein [Rhizobium sp. N6212]ANL01464.1 4'-phosphopantetheinyl transferase protein [Rhizobium sp. N621]ANL07587.1 4'-phosphopantetheinyl transferase protein [Rhizobium esperanzae]ANL13757.1 4'-phosphopantetheinyl transferase protein [Rhizobium sp. N1341]ANL25741.1 4'-phosphopantetheinyl transferase protein [Rhizobium sp. N113]
MQQSDNPAAIDVVLWQYPQNGSDGERWIVSLSSNERERAATYRFERDRTSFIAGRYLLRQVLSAHTETRPDKVVLLADAHGKLTVEGRDTLQFSLSNADGLVAVAVASECERVGIDCERADAEIEAAALESYCSPDERRWLDQLPAGEGPRAAIALWTLKESHLKALGVGLREDPRSVAFSWQDGIPVMVQSGEPDRQWHHRLIKSDSQHLIALAVRSPFGAAGIHVLTFQDESRPSE